MGFQSACTSYIICGNRQNLRGAGIYSIHSIYGMQSSFGRVNQTLGCSCLRCSTDDEMDHTMQPATFSNRRVTMIEEWFEVEPFSSIQGTKHVRWPT